MSARKEKDGDIHIYSCAKMLNTLQSTTITITKISLFIVDRDLLITAIY